MGCFVACPFQEVLAPGTVKPVNPYRTLEHIVYGKLEALFGLVMVNKKSVSGCLVYFPTL